MGATTEAKTVVFDNKSDDDNVFGSNPKKETSPKPIAPIKPETEIKQNPTPKKKHKMSNKLAAKFGHLNLDPRKMKVGAAPPKRKQEKQEMYQSVTLNRATVSKKGRRKRSKKKIKIDDDDGANTNVSASLFSSAPSIVEEKKISEPVKQSVFDDSGDDIDDVLVSSAMKKKDDKTVRDNLFGDSDEDFDDTFSGKFKKEVDAKIEDKKETIVEKKNESAIVFKESGIGGGFDLFDDESDDDFVKVKASTKVKKETMDTVTEKVDFDPLADETPEPEKNDAISEQDVPSKANEEDKQTNFSDDQLLEPKKDRTTPEIEENDNLNDTMSNTFSAKENLFDDDEPSEPKEEAAAAAPEIETDDRLDMKSSENMSISKQKTVIVQKENIFDDKQEAIVQKTRKATVDMEIDEL